MSQLLDVLRDLPASAADGPGAPSGQGVVVLDVGAVPDALEQLLGASGHGGLPPIVVVMGASSGIEGTDADDRIGRLEVDAATGDVRLGGRFVSTSPLERAVLRTLARRRGSVVTRDEIIRQIWGDDAAAKAGNLDNALLRLRRKLETDPTRPRHLVTVWGRGLMLETAAP
jgi:DNA-binding response OmpR family regulator